MVNKLKTLVFMWQVFEELLLDADWSVNAGSWMWLSCSSFFQQFFHCYCPVGFGRRTDPNGDFIRWVPFLALLTSYVDGTRAPSVSLDFMLTGKHVDTHFSVHLCVPVIVRECPFGRCVAICGYVFGSCYPR